MNIDTFGTENCMTRHPAFFNDRENLDLDWLEKSYHAMIVDLSNKKYEIENHFTSFDWLKIYSEAIQDCGVDMN